MSNPAPNPITPIKLRHGLSGWPPAGPNVFRWQDGCLTYSLTLSFDEILSRDLRDLQERDRDRTMTPTTAQWEEFWRVCDEIDVWSWPQWQGDMRVCDGLQWTTELEIGSRRMASMGQVYGSPPDFRPKLMRLHRALQAMAGWHTSTEDD